MATNLSILDLASVLAKLTEITKPYQLGIQLRISSSELDAIEMNHPRDIGRQKTEVIKSWLYNSPDASWNVLANAVERMGGHARLVERMRKEYTGLHLAEQSDDDDLTISKREKLVSVVTSRESCEIRNILILGKMGHGKSTLGNKMLNYSGNFKINNRKFPQTHQGSATFKSVTQCKNYEVQVYDHDGLFEGASALHSLSTRVPAMLNLVVFVLKCGCSFDLAERKKLEAVLSEWKIGRISALVLTHCERLSKEKRKRAIDQCEKDHPSVAKLMGKGILAVGFPDNSHIQFGSQLSQRMKEDERKLRQLIYSCEEAVYLQSDLPTLPSQPPQPHQLLWYYQPGTSTWPHQPQQPHQIPWYYPPGTSSLHRQPLHEPWNYEPQYDQNWRKWLYLCISVLVVCLCLLCVYRIY